MKTPIFYFRLRADQTGTREIYEIKGNKARFRLNLFMLFILWSTLISGIVVASCYRSPADFNNTLAHIISFGCVMVFGAALTSLSMTQFSAMCLDINHNAWYLHKIYLTSKYRCLYNENVSSLSWPETVTKPIRYIDQTKIFVYSNYKNFGIISYFSKRTLFSLGS